LTAGFDGFTNHAFGGTSYTSPPIPGDRKGMGLAWLVSPT
jgi:hypothetical protein